MSNWKTIETAPKVTLDDILEGRGDNKPLLLLTADGKVTVGEWRDGDTSWADLLSAFPDYDSSIGYDYVTPTHWMEFPDPSHREENVMSDCLLREIGDGFLGFGRGVSSGLELKLDLMINVQQEVLGVLQRILERQDEIDRRLGSLNRRERTMKVDLTDLKAQVRRMTTVNDSVKTLVTGLAGKVQELADQPTVDPSELQAIADELRAQSDSVAEVVVEGTPHEH